MPAGFFEKPDAPGQYLEQLKMCESARMLPAGHVWLNCQKDPTCVQCIGTNFMQSAKLMQDACFNDATRKSRESVILDAFGPPDDFDGPLIVAAVNSDYLSLMVNWACARLAFGLGNATQDTVLLTADMESYNLAVSLGFRAVMDPSVHFENHPVTYNDKHVVSQSMLFCMLHQLSEMGYDVILHDVDLVWKRDPRDGMLFNPQWNKVDIMGALAPRYDSHGPLNSGFVFMRSNRKVRAYLRTMVALTPVMYWLRSDQVIYNSLLRHWRFRQLHFHVLPRAAFVDMHTTTGKDGNVKLVNNETYVYHVVSHDAGHDKAMHKINRLRMVSHWFLQDTCTVAKHVNAECGHLDRVCRADGAGAELLNSRALLGQ